MKIIEKAKLKLRRHGLANVLFQFAMTTLNKIIEFRILRGVVIRRPDARFLQCPSMYSAMILSEEAIREFARHPQHEMSDQFVNQALARGDQCFAICDGSTLAAYGWYAFGPTPIGVGDLVLQYHRGWVYMYKGFTHERYRGQRLHAIGMTMALQHYLSKGYRGLVSYVESVNLESLKSCFRMGYSVFGSVYVAKLFARYFSVASPGCRIYQFHLERANEEAVTGLLFGKNRRYVKGA